jgi:hypothetical protein
LLATLLIEGLRPEGVMNRFVGPLDKGLAQKLGAAPPPMNGALLAATFSYRGDTAVLLNIGRTGKAAF